MAVPAKPEQDVNLFHYERAANSASDKEMAGHPHDTAPIEGTTIGPKGRWLSLRLILAIFSLAVHADPIMLTVDLKLTSEPDNLLCRFGNVRFGSPSDLYY
jgi:hypothetical protein